MKKNEKLYVNEKKKDGGKSMVKRKKKIHQCILKKMNNEWIS